MTDKCKGGTWTCCRDRRRLAKARGKKVDNDDDIPGDDAAAEQDPYFKHPENAFDDPFFDVSCSCPLSEFSIINHLLLCQRACLQMQTFAGCQAAIRNVHK